MNIVILGVILSIVVTVSILSIPFVLDKEDKVSFEVTNLDEEWIQIRKFRGRDTEFLAVGDQLEIRGYPCTVFKTEEGWYATSSGGTKTYKISIRGYPHVRFADSTYSEAVKNEFGRWCFVISPKFTRGYKGWMLVPLGATIWLSPDKTIQCDAESS